MRERMRILIGRLRLPLLLLLLLCALSPATAAAQTGHVSGGLMFDIRRYQSAGEGPKVYDGQPIGVFLAAGLFVTKAQRFSIEFEMSLSRDATTTTSIPLSIAGANPVDFTTTYNTRMQTYAGLFAVRLLRAPHVHLSVSGGAAFLHHRREIVPPGLLPADPRGDTPTKPIEIIDNVASPVAGVDAEIPLTSRLALVAALRVNRFTIATEQTAYAVRPMIGTRVLF